MAIMRFAFLALLSAFLALWSPISAQAGFLYTIPAERLKPYPSTDCELISKRGNHYFEWVWRCQNTDTLRTFEGELFMPVEAKSGNYAIKFSVLYEADNSGSVNFKWTGNIISMPSGSDPLPTPTPLVGQSADALDTSSGNSLTTRRNSDFSSSMTAINTSSAVTCSTPPCDCTRQACSGAKTRFILKDTNTSVTTTDIRKVVIYVE